VDSTLISSDWLMLLAVAATVGVMYLLARRLMKGMNQQDWILLRQAKSRGVDVSQPVRVDFVVFAASEETAQELSELMRQDGFETSYQVAQIQYARSKKKPGEPQDGWLVKGTRSTRLVPEELTRVRGFLNEIALARKAAYLGWQIDLRSDAQRAPPAIG
jgi:hypothetical protein